MIGIIGAGPAGNYLAYLLAKSGFQVDVYEEDKEIGRPVKCTGIVTHAIKELIKLPENIIINKITKYKIYSPSGKFIEFNLKKPDLILDRSKFDKYLSDLAKKAGAKYFLNHKFMDYNHKIITLKTEEKFLNKRADILIGADGPLSQVAKSINAKNEFINGIQGRYKIKKEKDAIEIYLGYGEFAWIVPESSSISRIGLCVKNNPKEIFERFIKEKAQGAEFMEYQSGLIPIYNSQTKIQKGNIFLLGDAASQVKATTYGGIIPHLISAQKLKEAIKENKNYEELLIPVKKELDLSLKLRKIMNKFTENDYNSLIEILSKKSAKNILETFDRDHPSKFIFKLALAQPKLLKFGLKLL